MAGILLFLPFGEKATDFNIIQNKIAVSNYYKFTLYNHGDVNPNTDLPSPENYWRLNDELAMIELGHLKPKIILSFNGGHVDILKKDDTRVITINDPSGILQGGGECLKPEGRWEKEFKKLKIKRYAGSWTHI